MKTKTRKKRSISKMLALPKQKLKVIELKNLPADKVFISTLREIGRPALVRELAVKLKNGRLLSTSKKKLMAKLYASASHLNRDGLVKRSPFNNSTYVYSLKEWKFTQKKTKARKAKPRKHRVAA